MEAVLPKILLWDIETAPMVATTWTLYPKVLSHENILRDWYIICGAWKWLGERRVYAHAVEAADCQAFLGGIGGAPDAAVVKALRDVVAEADVVVGHNGDAFDLKKLNARLIHHDLDPLPPIRTVDTLKEARKIARFSSNRLDFLAGELTGDGKIETTYGLWLRVMQGDRSALREMVRYNKHDVDVLEAVYNRLLPHMKSHPNVTLGCDAAMHSCPRCGSANVEKRGTAKTMTRVYQRYQCQDCGSWSRATRVDDAGPLR